MEGGLPALWGWFVPRSLRRQSEAELRARIFVLSCFAIVAFTIPFFLWSLLANGGDLSTIASLVGIGLIATNPFVLRWTGSRAVTAWLATVELIVWIGVFGYGQGGMDSAAILWNTAIPVLAGLWFGPRLALASAALIVAEMTGFYLLYLSGHAFPVLHGPSVVVDWRFAGAVATVVFLAGLVQIYEGQTLRALRNRAAELERRERAMRSIVNSAMDAVITFDVVGNVVGWDGFATEMFGWRRTEASGADLVELIFPSTEREAQRALITRLSEAGRDRVYSERREFKAMHRQGHEFPAELSVSAPFSIGDRTVFTAFVRDLTKAKRSAQRVRELRRDLQQILDNSPDGIIVHRGTEVVYANRTWTFWFDTAGGDLCDLVVEPDWERLLNCLLELGKVGVSRALGEFRFAAADGSELTLELIGVPGVHFEGEPSTLVVARDTSERRELQSKLALSDRMATMGTLMAGIAHEINNPLAYVIANLEFMQQELHKEVSPELREATDDAVDGAERVRLIVQDLRQLSRRDDEQLGAVRVSEVIGATLKLASGQVMRVATVVEEYGDTPPARASGPRITQVVLNLVVNAAQAFVERDPKRNQILIRTAVDQGRVLIEVTDNGPGISPRALDRIFDPFYTTKPVGVGTGLGLSICHTIVANLGGEMAVESRVGAGTTFRVWLPAADPACRQRRKRISTEAELSGRARILLVDDEPRILRAFGRALGAHEVTLANSGKEALETLAGPQEFDLVLCDLMMPDVNGMELFEQVREVDPDTARRFVFVTGATFDNRCQQFLDEVTNLRLEKPVSAARLTEWAARAAQGTVPGSGVSA